MAARQSRLVWEKKPIFFYFNWLPWQRHLTNRKSSIRWTCPYTRLPMMKFWWRSVHSVLSYRSRKSTIKKNKNICKIIALPASLLHDIATSSPLLMRTFRQWYYNSFSNDSAKNASGISRRSWHFPKINWLPWQRPSTKWKTRYRSIICTRSAFIWWIDCKNRSSISWDIRARQLYKNISMLFLFPVKDGKLSTGVIAIFNASCYG